MTWPQIVIASWFLLGWVLGVINLAKDKDMTPLGSTFAIAFITILRIIMICVLSAGGFW